MQEPGLGSMGLCLSMEVLLGSVSDVCVHHGVVHERVWGHGLGTWVPRSQGSCKGHRCLLPFSPPSACLQLTNGRRQETKLGRGSLLAQLWERLGMGPTSHSAKAAKRRPSASESPCKVGLAGGRKGDWYVRGHEYNLN